MKYLDRNLVVNPLYIAVCLKEKDYRREMKELKINKYPNFLNPGADSTTHTFSRKGGDVVMVNIGSLKGRTHVEIAGLFVHAAVHVWHETKERLYEVVLDDKFEALAIQKIFQQIMWAYEEMTAKK